MLVTLLGLLGVLGAAWWVTWPLLAGAPESVAPAIPEAPSHDERGDLGRTRDNALAAIREAEFDHRLGKLSDQDYGLLRAGQEERALAAIAAIAAVDEASPIERNALQRGVARRRAVGRHGFCSACGSAAPGDARFCKACGKSLQAPSGARVRPS
jgi:hypothetical protein